MAKVTADKLGKFRPQTRAAENTNRKARGCELSPSYLAIILQRYADHTQRTPVLLESA